MLKKTIHELKSQAEGKGGLNQQHDRALKAMQKSQDELQEQLNSALLENEKQAQRAKDLTEKVRQL
jgi:archaellum component FlaC